MQLPTQKVPFDKKKVETILRHETKFITGLFDLLPLPTTTANDDDILLEEQNGEVKKAVPQIPNKNKASRAKSLVELQKRLEEITMRKKLNYKEKLLKKNLKNKLKRKGKLGDKNATHKQERIKRLAEDVKEEEKPVTNSGSTQDTEGGMVFAKFDFSDIGKKKHKKEKKDPQKLLEDLKKQKQKIEELKSSGDVEKAVEIKEKSAWKNALARAQGEKVKDDEVLLQKTIKKRESKLKKSQKQWQQRQENVKKKKDERQKKRQENIDKRKKQKKIKKIKSAVKRGKVIPGF